MDIDGALAAASAHHRRGDAVRAEALCQEVLNANPEHLGALRFLAVLSSRRGDLKQAVALFRRAVSCAPNDAEVHVHLGHVLSDAGRETEAEDNFRRAIAIDPRCAAAHAALGVIRQRAGDLPEAVASYREALRLDPSPPLVHYNLATALRRQGEQEAAIAHARKVVDQLPGAPAPRILLAELHLESGDPAGALTHCEGCFKHEARNRRAMAIEAIATARAGDHESSRALLDVDRLVRLRSLRPPAPYPHTAGFHAALAGTLPRRERPCESEDSAPPSGPWRSGEFLHGAGDASGALAARFAEAVEWYLERRPRNLRHRFLKWRPRDFHVEGDALHLPPGARTEPEIRDRGWVSGVYAISPPCGPGGSPEIEVGLPPLRYRGGMRFEGRTLLLDTGRLILFPSYLYHSVRAPDDAPAHQVVITLDAVPD